MTQTSYMSQLNMDCPIIRMIQINLIFKKNKNKTLTSPTPLRSLLRRQLPSRI